MRYDLILTATLLSGLSAHAQTSTDTLAKLRGKARPVIVLSDTRDDPRVAKQIAALDQTRPDLDDRNIAVLRDAQPGSALRKSIGIEEKGFAVVLVGKDGGVKKVWHAPIDPKRIFTVIDRMPMRRQEMRG